MTVHLHDWRTGGSAVSPEVDHDIIAMRVSGAARLKQRFRRRYGCTPAVYARHYAANKLPPR